MLMKNNMCHCGEPLHYGDKKVENHMINLVQQKGRFIAVSSIMTGKVYKVDRHYIALHGLEGINLAESGFEEIKK